MRSAMVTAGIDLGARHVKVVVQEDGNVIGRGACPAGADPASNVRSAMDEAMAMAGIDPGRIATTVSTGSGRREIASAGEITEVMAVARAVHHLCPSARTAIDVGAEESRCLRIGQDGRVTDFVINEKCAAGSGGFVEAMARALETSVAEFGRISLRSKGTVSMSAQCTVFAESEVVSLVHSQTPVADIARAVMDAMASRVVSMARRVRIEPDLALVGGLASNPGFLDALVRAAGCDVIVPEHPDHAGALGAALSAADRAAGERP